MEKTIVCGNCRYEGSLAGFSYVALAGGRGPGTLLRCPACCELVIAEEYELSDDSALNRDVSLGRDQSREYVQPG